MDYDKECTEAGIDVPAWIEQDITLGQVGAIQYGGCESGAYMPACYYHQAAKTMREYGDDVLQYLEDVDSLPEIDLSGVSWDGVACHVLTCAVNAWAAGIDLEEVE